MYDNIDPRQIALYLMGENVPGIGRLKSESGGRLPLLVTPLVRHTKEIARFMVGAGLSINNKSDAASPAKRTWIQAQLDRLNTGVSIPEILKEVFIEGQIYLAIEQEQDQNGMFTGYYTNKTYVPQQVVKEVYANDGSLVTLTVNVVVEIDKKDMVKRIKYDTGSYQYWSPVPVSQIHLLDQRPPNAIFPHKYGKCPAVRIKNNQEGTPEFDLPALEMATEAALLMTAGAENMLYFGAQIIAAPDVKGTLMAIRNRLRVIQKLPMDEGGAAEAIDIKALPDNYEYFLKQVLNNLADHLGSPLVELNLNSDVSSMALKLVYAPTIATAQGKWASVITDGYQKMFELMLLFAGYDAILADVFLDQPDSYSVILGRTEPLFQMSPTEKQVALQVVQQLIMLGIEPSFALATEYYMGMSPAAVLDQAAGSGGLSTRETLQTTPNNAVPRSSKELPTKN